MESSSLSNFSSEFQEKRKQYDEEEKKAMSGNDDFSYKVELYIYDMTKGMASQMSPALLGKQIDGIWHTGIVAYGREYFFGSGGIQAVSPGGTLLGEPDRIEDLGNSQVPYQLFLEYIFGLGESSYKPGAYDLLKHNCNNFSEEVSEFLCGRGIPKNILSLPDEVLNTDLGSILAPLAKSLQLKDPDSLNVPLGGAHSSIHAYVPLETARTKEDTEFDELNSAIDEVRNNSRLLENRRNNLNEKILKKEKKEKKKTKKEKKKKKKLHLEEFENQGESLSLRKRGDSVHFASEPQIFTNGDLVHRRLSVPADTKVENLRSPHSLKSILRNSLPTRQKPPTRAKVSDFAANTSFSCTNQDISSLHHKTSTNSVSNRRRMEGGETEEASIQPTQEGITQLGAEAGAALSLPESSSDILETKIPREPPIVFKDDVDAVAEFDGFVNCVAELLNPEEQKHMEELRAYVVEDEGSWTLGEDFHILFARIFNDSTIASEAQKHLVRIMAGAALKDDVILMLHQDRKEHTIMNYANKIESKSPEIQEALALFFCNMFEHLSPSEWLLYISEWSEGSQQISNIRVTTKVSVNALLHSNPKVVDYGTALMYNLGTKEVKSVIFDDVAPELAMAILQFFGCNPSEEHIWRTLTALCRFCYCSSEVPALIQMIGPDPCTLRGKSERIDRVIEEINAKLSRVR